MSQPQPPVYSCHVYLAPPDAEGNVTARAASLPGVTAAGRSEREALRNIAAAIKKTIADCLAKGQPVP